MPTSLQFKERKASEMALKENMASKWFFFFNNYFGTESLKLAWFFQITSFQILRQYHTPPNIP